jgi:hypothetical protein
MDRACSTIGGEKECIWDGKARRKETTRNTKTSMGNNIKMDHREIGWGGTDWIDVVQDRDQCRALVNTVMKPQVT